MCWIGADFNLDWAARLNGYKLANGESLVVEQTRWKHMTVEAEYGVRLIGGKEAGQNAFPRSNCVVWCVAYSSEHGLFVHCRKDEEPFPNSQRVFIIPIPTCFLPYRLIFFFFFFRSLRFQLDRLVRPDFALIRNIPKEKHEK
jgi:hypothetical protein